MARIFIESFESQDLGLWDSGGSIVSTIGKDMKGDYCCNTGTDGLSPFPIIKIFSSSYSEIYCAFQFRPKKLGYSSCPIIKFYEDGYGSSLLSCWAHTFGYVAYSAIGASQQYNGAALIVPNTTYFFQLYYKIGPEGVGRIFSKINTVVDVNATDDTLYIDHTTLNKVQFGSNNYVNNIVIDDSIMPGETEIIVIRPNGDGYYSDWDPSSGANYTCVDELPYNDLDFVSSGIVNAKDTYTLEQLPSNAKVIKCIQMFARGLKEEECTLSGFNFVIREGSTDYNSATFLLSETFESYDILYPVDPINSQPWHPPSVNNMEIGIQART